MASAAIKILVSFVKSVRTNEIAVNGRTIKYNSFSKTCFKSILILDKESINRLANIIFVMEEVDHKRVAAFGKSLYIPLSSSLCRVMNIAKGSELRVYRDGDKIVHEKVKE